jgi:hypothetical protein
MTKNSKKTQPQRSVSVTDSCSPNGSNSDTRGAKPKTTPIISAKAIKPNVLPTPENALCGYCNHSVNENPTGFCDGSLQCGLCSLWFHNTCTNITEEIHSFLTKNQLPSIHWFCNSCEVMSKPVLGRITKLEQRMEQIENKLSDQELNSSRIASLPLPATGVSPQEVDSIAKELNDRSRRSKNILVFGLPEKHSSPSIESITQKLEITPIDTPFRLGKEQTGKNRPLLIRLESEDKKWKTLTKAKKLKAQGELPKEVVLKPDKTPTERQVEYELRKQLRERMDAGEENLVIRNGKITSLN